MALAELNEDPAALFWFLHAQCLLTNSSLEMVFYRGLLGTTVFICITHVVPYCRASRTVDGSDRWGLEPDDVKENCIKLTYFSEETRQKLIVNALTLTFIPLKFSVSSCFLFFFICCCFFIDQVPTLGWSE